MKIIEQESPGQVCVIALEGELTADDVEPLRRHVSQRIEQHKRDFVLDLSKVDVVDSKGLETLLWLLEVAGEHMGQVRLVAPHEVVREVMRITRLEAYFERHDDAAAALRSLN